MVCIFEKDTMQFDGIGLGTLSPSSCVVDEEINGGFELTMTHPYDNFGKWRRIESERIIWASTPDGYQLFRIYRVAMSDYEMKVYARHIFYDLLTSVCLGRTLTGTAADWMKYFDATFFGEKLPFTFGTDIADGKTATKAYDGDNQVSMLIADNDSFVSFFGGEIIRDKFSVFFTQKRGNDNGYIISYGKNLIGIDVDEDLTDTYTYAIADGSGVSRVFVESSKSGLYNNIIYKYMKFSDTDDDVEIRARVNALFDAGADLPTLNVQVDFVQLEKTEEYKHLSFLRTAKIGDTVKIRHDRLGFIKKIRMISYQWDCIQEMYNSADFGELRADLSTTITEGKDAFSSSKINNASISGVNNLLSGRVTNDYVYLPVDTSDYLTAQKLYRLGKNGMEYGENGYQGAFVVLVSAPES